MTRDLYVGIDVGSTTVKAVARRAGSDQILWQDYQRHETRQAAKVREFLVRMEHEIGLGASGSRVYLTGSGGAGVAPLIGGRFVQEVNAVSLAVEKSHPDVQSVVELGGQDAKLLFFQKQPGSDAKKKIATMNDKCAGGTGAILDKLSRKLSIPADRLCEQRYAGLALHRVAGKCGVFAETDINGLQKLGVPPEELMASLFEAIVLQNLSVLTRGHVLCPKVLLLGGPNTFIPGMREAWQAHIPKMWEERGVEVPSGLSLEELIFCPENGHYFAALGAIEYGYEQHEEAIPYRGTDELDRYLEGGDEAHRATRGVVALRGSDTELSRFLDRYAPGNSSTSGVAVKGPTTEAFLGIDGGSTSTKAVLIDAEGKLLARSYRLSNGNPIRDTIELIDDLRAQIESAGSKLEVLGAATTGYAKNVLERILHADVAVVETVAHAKSARHLWPEVDVIVDVGGQDIKLITLKDGRVKDFMLNTQCSAGNGYFLEATARSFGIDVRHYADRAFTAERMPEFSYGCAVFLQADIVSFQRKGWSAEEILAGLAAVLPKNIWLYVAKTPNLAALGHRFLLQGGTQRNLAAVKAQIDYIRSRFHDDGREPEIRVHPHCGEAGAIGAALEAAGRYGDGRSTSFVGLDAVRTIEFESRTDEGTRCRFCTNDCLRTFIDFNVAGRPERLIVANCEKGATEDAREVRGILNQIESVKKANPSLLEIAAKSVFAKPAVEVVAKQPEARASLRIGIPRLFNQYLYAPFFSGYLASLGVKPENIVWSDFTSNDLYRDGSRRGAVDPCFPSKVAIAHVHNLLYKHAQRARLDAIFLPAFDKLETHLDNCRGVNACPTVIATPLSVKAAFNTDADVFAAQGVRYLHPLLDFSDRRMLAQQMWECWQPVLRHTRDEHERALEQGFAARDRWSAGLRRQSREVLDSLERERRLGIVMLGRVYHHDPGLNHGLFEEFQKLGYPIFTQSTLPAEPDVLKRLFGDDHPLDIDDVWKHSYSASTSHKIWAAKYVARHPNLVAVEVSNFKCGHDAPAYQTIERIIESAGRPWFAFRDLDENKPSGSFRIRIETIHYFLSRFRDDLVGGRAVGRAGL